MRTDKIKGMILKAVEDERQTGRLAGALRTLAKQHNTNPSDQEIRDAVEFVREYVEHVPAQLARVLHLPKR